MEIKKVGVLSCGWMGSGITQVSTMAGFDTTVLEVEQKFLDSDSAGIEKLLSECAALDGIVQNEAIFGTNTIVDPVYCIRNVAVVRSLSRPPSADEFGMTKFQVRSPFLCGKKFDPR